MCTGAATQRRRFVIVLSLMMGLSWAPRSEAQVLPPMLEDAAATPETVEPVPDSLLARRLQVIFESVSGLGGVNATVTEGVVRLEGTVEQPEERRRAQEITSRLQGVVYVVNAIEAATDVETRLAPAVTKVREYWDGFVAQLPVLMVAALVVLIFVLASFLLKHWPRSGRRGGTNRLAWSFVSRLARGLLVLVGLVLAFDILGISSLMGAVLGTAGIVGLALGFAFQDIVENYLAGMLLSLRRPFSVNDLVKVGEYEGFIVRLTSREVIMLTYEGNHVRLPNAHVFKSPFTNFTVNPRRRFRIDVGVGTDEDLVTVLELGVSVLTGMPGIMADPPPFARVLDIGDWDVKVAFFGWVDQREADFLKVRSQGVRLIKEALDEAGIELPEPIYHVRTEQLPPSAAESSPRPVRRRVAPEDVAPDGKIDAQVLEDVEKPGEENLLTD